MTTSTVGVVGGSVVGGGGGGGVHTTNTYPGSFSARNTGITGDIMVNGRSLIGILDKLSDRLAILEEQDPAKLAKFEALRLAYDNYKLLEQLCIDH